MIAIATILGYVTTALSIAKTIQEVAGAAVDLVQDVKPIIAQATNLMQKVSAGEQITQEELDAIQAEGDRLTEIAEKHEAETPPANPSGT